MASDTPQLISPWPHRVAVAMVCATFPLIWVGGLVTTHQAGMAVPDWPDTYGYNLFLYPLSTWFFGPFDLFIEHGHRLLGATVGLLTIAFVIAVFRTDTRVGMRSLAVVALVGVCLQGGLGGMRVLLDERTLAMIHACVGPAFFAFTVALAAMTSECWRGAAQSVSDPLSGKIQRLAGLTVVLACLQLVLGAQLRHTPIDAGPAFFRAALYFHLFIAVALVVHSALLASSTARLRKKSKPLIVPSFTLLGLMAVQMALGAGSWVVKYGWPTWLGEHAWTASYTVRREDLLGLLMVTAHVAVGSSILATSLLVALRSFHYLKAAPTARISTGHPLLEVAV